MTSVFPEALTGSGKRVDTAIPRRDYVLPSIDAEHSTESEDDMRTHAHGTDRKTLTRTGRWAPLPKVAAGLLMGVLAWGARGELSYPPKLSGDKPVAREQSAKMLEAPTDTILEGVRIARTAPVIDVMFFPGQNYPGRPWSDWGDALYAEGCFFAGIGDHLSPRGSAMVYRYDPQAREISILTDVRRFLETGDGNADPDYVAAKGDPVRPGPGSLLAADENYTPGKIHSRIDMGSDGWLYYSTHRGSPGTTSDAYGYRGDWILRTHPVSGLTEIVAAYPVPKHCMPASVLDPVRMIFYAGTAAGRDAERQEIQFLAYDVRNRRVLKTADGGFSRYAILDRDSGRVFWDGKVYDPETNEIKEEPHAPSPRSATRPTADGWVYGTTARDSRLWAFNVRTREQKDLGEGAVGSQHYITTIEVDPTGRYLYYVPGAHGGGTKDGAPVVQFDIKTGTRKILAFLYPFLMEKHGYITDGTFGTALDDKGERLFIAWNGKRDPGARGWDSCLATLIHIPATERLP